MVYFYKPVPLPVGTHIQCTKSLQMQDDQIGGVFKVLGIKFSDLEAQTFGDFFGYIEKHPFLR